MSSKHEKEEFEKYASFFVEASDKLERDHQEKLRINQSGSEARKMIKNTEPALLEMPLLKEYTADKDGFYVKGHTIKLGYKRKFIIHNEGRFIAYLRQQDANFGLVQRFVLNQEEVAALSPDRMYGIGIIEEEQQYVKIGYGDHTKPRDLAGLTDATNLIESIEVIDAHKEKEK